jgi:hypothetical protein
VRNPRTQSVREDRLIWLASGVASLVINGAVGLSLLSVAALERRASEPPMVVAAPVADLVVVISPEMLQPAPAPAPADPQFARTSPDQQASRPERPRYFGERDTTAASEADPLAGALEVPSQDGVDPRDGEIETTDSVYQDGSLQPQAPAAPAADPALLAAADPAAPAKVDPALLAKPAAPPVGEELADAPAEVMPAAAGSPSLKPAELLEGTRMVDTPERLETSTVQPLVTELAGEPAAPGKPVAESPPERPVAEAAPAAPAAPASLPKPSSDPAFSGYQEKTKMQGSISRKGKAALDVADSALGRYQAELSRAVELEWQRNCVRYRDLITPGFITVRFVVNSKGKVTTLAFVEAVEVGEVQKGFTVTSIRNAQIPSMPAEVTRELNGEPLELTFNFYF